MSSAKHSKAVAPEAVTPELVTTALVEPTIAPRTTAAPATAAKAPAVNRHDAIAKIAYGYWVARGYQGGNSHEDWLRAEQEYLRTK